MAEAQRVLLLQAQEELLSGQEHATRPALLTVRAGAGGVDAEDWAQTLMSMYLALSQGRGWKIQLLEQTEGREGGLRSATLQFKGRGAYPLLRHEHGSHRVAHHSRFGQQGKRQTSFAAVEVLPDLGTGASRLDLSEVEISTYAGSSKGGQHANRSSTNVRAVHRPTGLSAKSQGRSLTQNRENALRVLAARVAAERERQQQADRSQNNVSAGFGQRIRSYTFTPYQMVQDGRVGFKSRKLDDFLQAGPEMQDLMWRLLVA